MIILTKSPGSPKSLKEAPRKLQKNSGQNSRNIFVGILDETDFSWGHFETNWPLVINWKKKKQKISSTKQKNSLNDRRTPTHHRLFENWWWICAWTWKFQQFLLSMHYLHKKMQTMQNSAPATKSWGNTKVGQSNGKVLKLKNKTSDKIAVYTYNYACHVEANENTITQLFNKNS